jgi:hypothetical protein
MTSGAVQIEVQMSWSFRVLCRLGDWSGIEASVAMVITAFFDIAITSANNYVKF